jgi:protein-S-isoprenylcysteine O-methyltransferase Ste14
MELYGKHSSSIPQKITVNILEIFLLWLSFWILFEDGGSWVQTHLHIYNAMGANARRVIIFIFNLIIFLRIGFMMFFLLNRKIPWEESFSIPFAFALYYLGFSLLVLPVSKAIDWVDYLGILLFVAGCLLNTGSEILRNQWKRNPQNKGKIYTGGLFSYSRHINYFGDLVWVSAYAVITRNPYAITIPAFLFYFFAFYNAPKLDRYLRKKYGSGYDAYAGKTKMLIPFIY